MKKYMFYLLYLCFIFTNVMALEAMLYSLDSENIPQSIIHYDDTHKVSIEVSNLSLLTSQFTSCSSVAA